MLKQVEIRNPILKSFLADEEHFKLYRQYNAQSQDQIKELLDEKFTNYYSKTRAIAYFSKTIHFTAMHFDKKERQLNQRHLLYLDRQEVDINTSSSSSSVSIKDQIIDDTASSLFEEQLYDRLEDYIENPQLFHALHTLTKRQQQILYLTFVHNMSDTEISKQLQVSQQAITKSKNSALKKVRRLMDA